MTEIRQTLVPKFSVPEFGKRPAAIFSDWLQNGQTYSGYVPQNSIAVIASDR
jgi:hypothetical protein